VDGVIYCGSHEAEYWDTWVEVDGTPKVGGRKKRKERYIRFRMPWKRLMFSITNDDERLYHPTFVIYWYNPTQHCPKPASALCIRMGWTSSD
jgi:hypothetical protein